MAGLRGLFVQRDGSNNGTVPKGARLALGGLLAPGTTDPLSVRTGVLVDGMGPVVVGTGAMSYQVRAFVGVTKYADSNGPVVAANDGPVTVTTTPSPGSNSRIDRVWMIQRLVTGDGGAGTTNVFEFGVTQGAVNASPVAPSIPAGAVALYDFTVTAGATSTAGLTAVRRHEWTVANGGIVPQGDGTGLVWDGAAWSRTPIGFLPLRMLYRSATANIPNNSPTDFTGGWDNIAGAMGDESGITYSGGALTVSRAGLYRIKVMMPWPSMSSGNRYAGIWTSTNGGSAWSEIGRANAPAGGLATTYFERQQLMAAGQMLRVRAEQTSGGTVTIGANYNTTFEVELLRPA